MATRKGKGKGAPVSKPERTLTADMPLDERWSHRLVRLEGITPVLFGKPALTPNPGQSASLTGETNTRELARLHMHADDKGEPGVPLDMLWACLRQAGRHFKHKRRQLSTSQKTILHFFMELTGPPMIRLKNGRGDLHEQDMQVHIDHPITSQQKMITTYKARFDNWAIEVPISINVSPIGGLTLRDYQDIIRVAGTGYGMGSRRPERGGPYGKFRMESWKEIKG